MLGVEAMAEGMGDLLVGHDPPVPGRSKPPQAVHFTRRLKDRWHGGIIASLPHRSKMTGAAPGARCQRVHRARVVDLARESTDGALMLIKGQPRSGDGIDLNPDSPT